MIKLVVILLLFVSACATPKSLLLELPEEGPVSSSKEVTAKDSRVDPSVIRRDNGGAVVTNSIPEYLKTKVVKSLEGRLANPLEVELLLWNAKQDGSELKADAVIKASSGSFSGKYIGQASVISVLIDEEDEVKVLVEALNQAVSQLAADRRLVQ